MSAEKAKAVKAARAPEAMPAAEVVVDAADGAKKERVKRTVTQSSRQLPILNQRVGEELRELDAADPWPDPPVRPKTRGDCLPGGCNEQRPCPWVSCKYHLFLEVKPSGAVQVNFPGAFERMPETCALDVADRADEPRVKERGGDGAENDGAEAEDDGDRPVAERLPKSHHINGETETLERVGRAIHLTRERVRQIVAKAVARARRRTPARTAIAVWDALEQLAEAPEGASRDTSRDSLPCPVVARRTPTTPPTTPTPTKRRNGRRDVPTEALFQELMQKTDPMQVKNRPRRA